MLAMSSAQRNSKHAFKFCGPIISCCETHLIDEVWRKILHNNIK